MEKKKINQIIDNLSTCNLKGLCTVVSITSSYDEIIETLNILANAWKHLYHCKSKNIYYMSKGYIKSFKISKSDQDYKVSVITFLLRNDEVPVNEIATERFHVLQDWYTSLGYSDNKAICLDFDIKYYHDPLPQIELVKYLLNDCIIDFTPDETELELAKEIKLVRKYSLHGIFK